ncbi:hypothetical protein JCM10213_003772 [Rhodosporidiobolus nylandii]
MRLSKNAQQTAVLAAAAATAAPSLVAGQDDQWTLSTADLQRDAWQVQPYVANGYIGQRIPAEGFGYKEFTPINQTAHDGTQGWPLFTPRQASSMVAGFYDHQDSTEGTNFPEVPGGQEPISTLPTWSSLYLTINNQTYSTLTPDTQISNWTQSLSVQDGVVSTSLKWTPEVSSSAVSLEYTIIAHRDWPNVAAVKLQVDGLQEGSSVAVTDVLDGAGAWRTDFVSSGPVPNTSSTHHTAVSPVGVPNVTAYEVSVLSLSTGTVSSDAGANCLGGDVLSTNASTSAQCLRLLSLPSGGSLTAVKYVGIASTDAFPGTELQTALEAAQMAADKGWEELLLSHRAAWGTIWEEGDIEIPGEENEELQLATRATLFHLLSNVRSGNESTGLGDNSIAPAGLTSDSYAGQIFWDADTWMYPGLLALHPSYAESVVDFRYRQLGQAQQNAASYNLSGALYPWTGGRTGKCTGVGPCYDYEYHLNSDIALAAWQYYAATGNQTWLEEKGWPLVQSIAEMFASFVVYNETTGKYDTYNETSPDEYSNHRNNSAMINGALSITLRQASELGALVNFTAPAEWASIEQNITILSDPQSGILLEFDGFNGTTAVKQADVVLLTYPFEYSRSTTLALSDLDFYSLATSPNGPGMTYSVFSIIASELSPIGCASYSYFLQSAQPYSRAPYYQFSEQTNDVYATNGGTNPAWTFLTGHGGFLQTLTHGFTGYRFRTDRLYFDPVLPPQLTNYTLKGLKWHGDSFDVNVQTANTTITRRSGGIDGNVTVEIAARNAQPGTYSLAAGESLTIPTASTNGTLIPNNLAQCATVLGNDTRFNLAEGSSSIVPGEFGLSAVDGANATTWQPLTADPTALVVDLGSEKTIQALHMNWGSEPPKAYQVAVANSSDFSTSAAGNSTSSPAIIASGNVSASDLTVLSAAEANTVAVHIGNLTDYALLKEVVGRYVELTISGSWNEESGYGGTVAEFAVIGQ